MIARESSLISRLFTSVLIAAAFAAAGGHAQTAALPAPTDVTPRAGAGQVTLTWTAPAGAGSATTYNVYASTSYGVTASSQYLLQKGVTGTTYPTPSILTPGMTYYFVVTAVNNGTESAASTEVYAAPSAAQTQLPANGTSGAANSTATSATPGTPSKPATPTTPALPGAGTGGTTPGSSSAPAAAAPSTNVGAATGTNVQSPDIALTQVPDSAIPAIVSQSSGSLTWNDSAVYSMIQNACAARPAAASAAGSASSSSTHTVPPLPNFDSPSTFMLINVIRFATGSGSTQTVQSTNWYVYSKNRRWYQGWLHGWGVADFNGATRLYGARNIVIVSILLNETSPTSPTIGYKFAITKEQPTNVASALALLGAVFPAGPPAGPSQGVQIPVPANYWGCGVVPVAYQTSSIKVDTTYSAGSASPFTASVTFTNEPKEWWDVSFALPVTKASALQYSSTANTVTASTINKQSLYAVADFYFPPANLSATSYNLVPHPFAGVAMNSQPLHSLLFGGAIGLSLAEVYAGATLIKQQQLTSGLAAGSTATTTQLTSATTYGYKAGFSVGIKISIKSALSAISSASSSSK